MSLMVISPTSLPRGPRPAASRCGGRCRISLAFSRRHLAADVTRLSLVINIENTPLGGFPSKRRSALVQDADESPPGVLRRPEPRRCDTRASPASPSLIGRSGDGSIGSMHHPPPLRALDFVHLERPACSARDSVDDADPPSWRARSPAGLRDRVHAAETIGILMRMLREKTAAVLTSPRSTAKCAGTEQDVIERQACLPNHLFRHGPLRSPGA